MKFRYIISALNKNGSREKSVQEFDKSEILIGRGPTCDILLVGRLISLTHARIGIWREYLVIEDLESLSGVFVNGNLVKHKKLRR
jgi:pSer/pThr/pTyr-binding forkhead associated (FHA) protein